jgi:hypothetical protein
MKPRRRKRNEPHRDAPKADYLPISKVITPKGCDSKAAMFYCMRRSRVPERDPFSLVSDFLFHRLAGGQLYITVLAQDVATFSSDNWSWFGAFSGKVRIAMDESPWRQCAVALILRRFEEGPRDPVSGLPYKTLSGLFFCVPPKRSPSDGYWMEFAEEIVKKAHRTETGTGRPIDVEPACLFSSFSEMYPDARLDLRQADI